MSPSIHRLFRLLGVCLAAAFAPIASAQRITDPWSDPAEAGPGASGLDVRELGTPPKVLLQTGPVYPTHLKQSGVEGFVNVGFVVDAAGQVVNLRILSSSLSDFERSALDAVSAWKFEPGIKDGRPAATNMVVNIRFHLSNNPQPRQAPPPVPPATNRADPNSASATARTPARNATVAPPPTYVWEIIPPKVFPDSFPENFRYTEPPRPLVTAFPVYPFAQLSAGTKGTVTVGVVVNPAGRVSEVNVLGERPAREFEMAVRAAMNQWVFQPARREGQPCFAALSFTIQFSPEGTATVPLAKEAKDVLAEVKKNSEKIVPLEELDRLPMAHSRRPALYPVFPGGSRPSGSAVVEFLIDEKGDVRLPRVVSATNDIFAAAAVHAVSTWRFGPPIKNRRSVIARAQSTLEFASPPETAPRPQP
jgi:TonB family protein